MVDYALTLKVAGQITHAEAFYKRALNILKTAGRESDQASIKRIESNLRSLKKSTKDHAKVKADKQRYCCNILCTEHESEGRPFQLCAGCKLACYCSKLCQRHAWKVHKESCIIFSVRHGRRR